MLRHLLAGQTRTWQEHSDKYENSNEAMINTKRIRQSKIIEAFKMRYKVINLSSL